jgi:hypothetical protein
LLRHSPLPIGSLTIATPLSRPRCARRAWKRLMRHDGRNKKMKDSPPSAARPRTSLADRSRRASAIRIRPGPTEGAFFPELSARR